MSNIDFQNGLIVGLTANGVNIPMIVNKINTEVKWLEENPVLLNGEIIAVTFTSGTRLKVGDGVRAFSELEYLDADILQAQSELQSNLQKKADLDDNGIVLTSQLPSYVDDVVDSYITTDATDFSLDWLSDVEGNKITPEKGKIYLIITEGDFHNKQYRWSGTTYSLCNPSDVNSVNGKTGIVELVPSDIGAEPEGAETRANAYTDEALIPVNQAISNTYTKNEIDTKVKIFHATLDPITTQYIKDSGDFTYADVLATENCKIEAKFGNVTIILNKEIIRNIEPDPIAGRYVEFSALLRNGLTTVKVFLFVYDPENLPTDAASVEILKDWGNSQYCGIAVQHIVIGDFLDNDIEAGKNNTINAPSTKAIRDYVVTNFEQNSNKIQNLFDYSTDTTKYPSAKATYDLMKFVYDLVMPVAIYDDPTGFEANNEDVGNWQLTGLNLAPYKRVKFYIKAAESGGTGSPSHIVEIHLDDRAKNSQGHFTGGHTAIFPESEGKFHNVVCTVSGDKTAVAFNKAYRYSASTAATSSGGRYCYLIEGYYI